MICPICHKESPCCDCDIAWLEMVAKLEANFRAWRERGRREQAEQTRRAA